VAVYEYSEHAAQSDRGRLRMGAGYITGNERPASGRESEERSEVIATTLDQHANAAKHNAAHKRKVLTG